MEYIPRIIDIKKILKAKSAFLLGPRQTGKSALIRNELAQHKTFNLLRNDTFLRFSRNLNELREQVSLKDELVIIDEVQRLPDLLNEVHDLIEERGTRFLLTGSSARKLRHKGVNLLGGRARQYAMHPFVCKELGDQFDLLAALNHGLLPSIYASDDPEQDLDAYIGLYLKEEIVAEALTRKIDAYSRFLQVAALANAQLVNHTNIANDAQVPRTTVIEYFGVLVDTLFASFLEPWDRTVKRKPIATAKLYFFDPGVAARLQERGAIKIKSPQFGDAFETYIFHELKTFIDYTKPRPLHFWRSTSHFEVDFIFDHRIAIEVKGKSVVSQKDLQGIRALKEEKLLERYYVVSLEPEWRKTDDGIEIIPWRSFVNELWEGLLS